MIQAAGNSTPSQTSNNSNNTGTTGPGFPTHNPAQQNQQFMNKGAGQQTANTPPTPPKNAAGATPPSTPKFPDPTKNVIKSDGSNPNNPNNPGGSDTTKPKRKINMKLVVGLVVLLLVILGSGAGFYLTQYTQQDIRQQAYLGQACNVDQDCTNYPNEICDGGSCVTAPPSGNLCPNPPNAPASGYIKFTCPNGCTLNTEDGITAWRCYENRVDSSTPLSLNGECGQVDVLDQNGAYCGYTEYTCDEPRCQPQDTTYQCNSDCSTTAQCQGDLGSSYSCVNSKCRLTANPSSSTCEAPSGEKTISGRVYCEANDQPIGNAPIFMFDSGGNTIAQFRTPAAGTWSKTFAPIGGNHFAVRIPGIDIVRDPAFQATGTSYCPTPHESCDYPAMPNTQTGFDFKTNAIATSVSDGCQADGYMNITWTMAQDYQGNLIQDYILRLDYDESQDVGVGANTWKPGTIAEGGNANDYWRYVPISVGSCNENTKVCTVDTHVFDDETGAYAKPWKSGRYFINVNAVSNESDITGQQVIELCRASKTATCTPGEVTYECNSSCETNAQCRGDLGSEYSCVNNKCRLTSNPTSATCEPPVGATACNETCETNEECTNTNPDYTCDDSTNTCRLASNPTSTTCQEPLTCNQACDPEAANDLCTDANANWSCDAATSTCRLTSNPVSATCSAPLTCNDSCSPTATDNDLCTEANANWSCDTTTESCRLTENPTSESCDPAPLVCNETCDPNASRDLCTAANENWVCDATSSTCRFETNPTSESCEPPVGAVACNEECTTNEECTNTDPDYTCDTTSNTCRLAENPTSESCEPEPPACNESCATNAECEEVNPDHFCDEETNTCRLAENPDSDSCEPAPEVVALSCNEVCTTNADCSDTSHICATTADGSQRCRLADNPDSTSCTLEGGTTQPTLPPELPETGPEDWLNWFKAGLVTLGLGAALFFLL